MTPNIDQVSGRSASTSNDGIRTSRKRSDRIVLAFFNLDGEEGLALVCETAKFRVSVPPE